MPAAPAIIGLVSVSDRASRGEYQDLGIPALREWLARALITPWRGIEVLIADETAQIQAALLRLIDEEKCSLVLTTGGTGPAARDVTPEATLAVAPARTARLRRADAASEFALCADGDFVAANGGGARIVSRR